MPAGPMQYGAYNNAGGDETSLDSNSPNTSAFTVYGGKRGVEAYQSQDYAYPANQNVSAVPSWEWPWEMLLPASLVGV